MAPDLCNYRAVASRKKKKRSVEDRSAEPVLRFTEDHFWVRAEDDFAQFGISEIGQLRAGEILAVELPEVGDRLERGEVCGELETARTVQEFSAPVSGTVSAINSELEEQPNLANEDPYYEGWLVEIELQDPAELDELLSTDEYEELITEEEED
jgi:glycine cleavage system H protein